MTVVKLYALKLSLMSRNAPNLEFDTLYKTDLFLMTSCLTELFGV